MTDNEIIQALKCCKSSVASCEECPMHVEGVICHGYELNRKALDLIISQQAEIERLSAENMLTMSERNAFRTSFYEISKQLKTAKSEAVKEFVKEHKEIMRLFLDEDNDFLMKWCEYEVNTDNLVKEMVGDTE